MSRRGLLVIVGGQSRKTGKTQAVCDIIAATPAASWVAVKIAPHREHPERSGSSPGTDRYLAAGAVEASLVDDVEALRVDPLRNTIVESNALAARVKPDLFVFVADKTNPSWKESARAVVGRADFVVQRQVTPEVLDAVRTLLSGACGARRTAESSPEQEPGPPRPTQRET